VEFTGFLEGEAFREAVTTADVFVLPTRQDTYAAVAHEAACLGLPLLVSHHAGACEALVQDGATGFAIDPADIETFADRMRTLCEDSALRDRMRRASRAEGERLSSHQRALALAAWIRKEISLA
jgi:glycosyltransferase involved in cell wall biosynthesis